MIFAEKFPQNKAIYQSLLRLAFGLVVIVLVNTISSYVFNRIDLTSERRFTLSPATRKLLSEVDDIVYFRVYLYGEYPAGFKKLERETRDMLNEFRAFNRNIEYRFINPSESKDPKEREKIHQQLIEKGLEPTDLKVRTADGMTSKIIFPGAIVSYHGREIPVSLLVSRRGTPPEEILNSSIENLEFVLADAIRKLVSKRRPRVAFIEGHGELNRHETADAMAALSEYYVVERVRIDGKLNSLAERDMIDSLNFRVRNKYQAIIIAKPDSAFSEKDKFIIDQYIMRGGRVFWLIDPIKASMDSLQHNDQTIGLARDLNLSDMFFKYGFRINNDLLMDLSALPIPVKTGQIAGQPQFEFYPWYYFPILTPMSDDPIVRNLNTLKTEFISSIDFVESGADLKKTVLLTTSRYSRAVRSPVLISLEILGKTVDERIYNRSNIPVAVKVEGVFESLYTNRIPPEIAEDRAIGFLSTSLPTKMVAVGDGDMIRNQIQFSKGNYVPLPLGYDRYTRLQFGNRDFLLNVMNYLTDDSGLISIRSRVLKMRMLDKVLVESGRVKWQIINVGLPVIWIIVFGILQMGLRRRNYAR